MSEKKQNRTSSQRRSASGGRREQQEGTQKKRRSLGATIAIRFFQVVGTLLLVAIITGAFLACYAAVYVKSVIMPETALDLSAFTMNENSVIYYYDQETGEAKELTKLVGLENREWVDYEDIPQDLIHAFIAIEDKRFYQHNGVDWYRTGGAFINMFLGMKNTFGGSTITQQLIKNITEYDDVTVKRKILEIFTALELEKNYDKEEIITYYLNEIFLGSGCYGVQSAAQFYFGKDVSDLTLAECASLAGITNNPSQYSPNAPLEVTRYLCKVCEANGKESYALHNDEPCATCGEEDFYPGELWTGREYNKQRQELILESMADPEISPEGAYITEAERDAAIAETLVFTWDAQDTDGDGEVDTKPDNSAIYSWYVEAVINEVINDLMESTGRSREYVTHMVYSGGLKIYVPYDPAVQAKVDQIYNDRSNLNYTSKTGQKMSSAITVVDNANGYVVALSGDVGEKEINRGWNNALSNQQPGSSIKPLSVYSPALELGLITPATVSDDNPRLLNNNPWPVNAPRGYRGLTTVQDGVVRSVNTVAVNVLTEVTPEVAFQFVTEKYGLSLESGRQNSAGEWKSDIAISPLAMGGLTDGVTTFEMAAAYATFPRNGVYTEPTTYLRIENMDGELLIDNTPESKTVIEESTAYYINHMLTNAVNGGTGYNARISGQTVAGKTGTTNEVYDLWFAGYTPYYTAVVWTGYPYDEYIPLSGNPSVTLWQKVMSLVHADLPRRSFPTPDNLGSYSICLDCGNLATGDCEKDLRGSRAQTFRLIRGDQPTESCVCHVPVTICTECPILNEKGEETGAYHMAGEFCPEESVKEVTMVDYVRELVKENVVVDDYFALMSIYDDMEDTTCTTHTEEQEPEPEPSVPGGDEPGVDPNPDVTDPPMPEPTPDATLPPDEET